jgi:hypothetical protein
MARARTAHPKRPAPTPRCWAEVPADASGVGQLAEAIAVLPQVRTLSRRGCRSPANASGSPPTATQYCCAAVAARLQGAPGAAGKDGMARAEALLAELEALETRASAASWGGPRAEWCGRTHRPCLPI